MLQIAMILIALAQAPAVIVDETCWVPSTQSAFATDFGGFSSFGGSYRTQSWSFNQEEFGVAPSFRPRFGSSPSFGSGFGVPIQSSFGYNYSFSPGFGQGFGSPRIKIKNKIKFHGRRW